MADVRILADPAPFLTLSWPLTLSWIGVVLIAIRAWAWSAVYNGASTDAIAIRDSDAEMAGGMPLLVRKRIVADQSIQGLRRSLTCSCRDNASYDLSSNAMTLPLSIAPLLLAIGGPIAVSGFERRRR